MELINDKDAELDVSNPIQEPHDPSQEFDSITLGGTVVTPMGTSKVKVVVEFTDPIAAVKMLVSLGSEKNATSLLAKLFEQYGELGDGEESEDDGA